MTSGWLLGAGEDEPIGSISGCSFLEDSFVVPVPTRIANVNSVYIPTRPEPEVFAPRSKYEITVGAQHLSSSLGSPPRPNDLPTVERSKSNMLSANFQFDISEGSGFLIDKFPERRKSSSNLKPVCQPLISFSVCSAQLCGCLGSVYMYGRPTSILINTLMSITKSVPHSSDI